MADIETKPRIGICRGFTLLELIVVMALITLMFFFTFPRIHRFIFDNRADDATRTIAGMVLRLKRNAVVSRVRHTLHIDMYEGRIWATSESMDEFQQDAAYERGVALPSDMRVLGVDLPLKKRDDSGRADIVFYPGGYSDKAVVYLEKDSGESLEMVIEPFLPDVAVRERRLF